VIVAAQIRSCTLALSVTAPSNPKPVLRITRKRYARNGLSVNDATNLLIEMEGLLLLKITSVIPGNAKVAKNGLT
tara:strand:- start:386 stop:610 length:225 start_codon:yes stop_codon:yes gene_type:complete